MGVIYCTVQSDLEMNILNHYVTFCNISVRFEPFGIISDHFKVPECSKTSKMVSNGPECFKIFQDGPKWFKTGQSGSKIQTRSIFPNYHAKVVYFS
jgi:hypothetical protein